MESVNYLGRIIVVREFISSRAVVAKVTMAEGVERKAEREGMKRRMKRKRGERRKVTRWEGRNGKKRNERRLVGGRGGGE